MKKLLITLFVTVAMAMAGSAQDKTGISARDYENTQVEMADKFRADGKIYVVVLVMIVISLGMYFFLYRIDRKLRKLEQQFRGSRESGSDQGNDAKK